MRTLSTVEGIYEDGMIRLENAPAGIKRSRVLVTFIDQPTAGETTTRAGGRMETGPPADSDFSDLSGIVGVFDSGVPDLGSRHDNYIAEALEDAIHGKNE